MVEYIMQAAPAEWSIVREAFRAVEEVASGLTVAGVLLVVIWALWTGQLVRKAEHMAALRREEEWKQEARRGERLARRGAETIETTAEAVEKQER